MRCVQHQQGCFQPSPTELHRPNRCLDSQDSGAVEADPLATERRRPVREKLSRAPVGPSSSTQPHAARTPPSRCSRCSRRLERPAPPGSRACSAASRSGAAAYSPPRAAYSYRGAQGRSGEISYRGAHAPRLLLPGSRCAGAAPTQLLRGTRAASAAPPPRLRRASAAPTPLERRNRRASMRFERSSKRASNDLRRRFDDSRCAPQIRLEARKCESNSHSLARTSALSASSAPITAGLSAASLTCERARVAVKYEKGILEWEGG